MIWPRGHMGLEALTSLLCNRHTIRVSYPVRSLGDLMNYLSILPSLLCQRQSVVDIRS